MRNDILERKDEILNWIEQNRSKAFICKELHCKPETLNSYLIKMGIEYSGNQGSKGIQRTSSQYMPLEQYLAVSKNIQTNKIRQKLLREGYKKHICENCGLSEWLGNHIPLEVHHIDGNSHHNEISNYQLLCPNCHALTDSYRGKNSAKEVVRRDFTPAT